MSKRQPARNPFSFKKITLAGPTGGGGVSGGSAEGAVSGSASNNHLEKNANSIPQSDAWSDSPCARSPYNSQYLFQARILWTNYFYVRPCFILFWNHRLQYSIWLEPQDFRMR